MDVEETSNEEEFVVVRREDFQLIINKIDSMLGKFGDEETLTNTF